MVATKSFVSASSVLHDRLIDARRRTDDLFDLVPEGALYERPIDERHRIVFYIGHLEAFDWNLLSERLLGLPSTRPDLDRLFAFGIDPVGGNLPTDQASDWPELPVVRDYVCQVRGELDEGLARIPDEDVREFSPNLLLNVAIEHRLMHAETLAYMLHRLPVNRKMVRQETVRMQHVPFIPSMIQIPAGPATLGLPRDGEVFGWDNEFEQHMVWVPALEMDRYKVTNGEYLRFMAAGGYEKRELWSDAAWEWKASHGIEHPAFWLSKDEKWYWLAMFEEVPLPLDWPVYVSHAEASAYARWAGKSLPTEAQWQRAAYGSHGGGRRQFPWGGEAPTGERGNFDLTYWDPTPVAAHPDGASAFGVEGMLGNGWEWTSTLFQPFSGFEPFPFYRGYSADFFDGKHYVIKGASPRTAACMLRASFRNWFQPHYQYVYSGFRCVSNPEV